MKLPRAFLENGKNGQNLKKWSFLRPQCKLLSNLNCLNISPSENGEQRATKKYIFFPYFFER